MQIIVKSIMKHNEIKEILAGAVVSDCKFRFKEETNQEIKFMVEGECADVHKLAEQVRAYVRKQEGMSVIYFQTEGVE